MFGMETCSAEQLEYPVRDIGGSSGSSEIENFKHRKKYPNLLFVFVIQMVASAMDVDASEIRRLPRGNAKLCRARQIAMYLLNVVLACSFKEIGDYLDRDRTTVSYACGVIEELRDVPAFDDKVKELEDILNTVVQLLPKHLGSEQ